MKKILLLLGAAALAVIAVSTAAYGAGKAFGGSKTETHAVSESVRAVDLEVEKGRVELVAGEHASVRETRRWGLGKPKVTRSVRDGVLTIKADCPGGWFSDCATDLRVTVPAGAAVTVKANVGDVHGTSLAASTADVRTDVGDVRLGFANRPARLTAQTNVGDVELGVPDGTYAVETSADVGDEDVRNLTTDDGAGERISAKTDVGDVDVTGR
jgi:hypothetical protein